MTTTQQPTGIRLGTAAIRDLEDQARRLERKAKAAESAGDTTAAAGFRAKAATRLASANWYREQAR